MALHLPASNRIARADAAVVVVEIAGAWRWHHCRRRSAAPAARADFIGRSYPEHDTYESLKIYFSVFSCFTLIVICGTYPLLPKQGRIEMSSILQAARTTRSRLYLQAGKQDARLRALLMIARYLGITNFTHGLLLL